jgi:hypothetical protein
LARLFSCCRRPRRIDHRKSGNILLPVAAHGMQLCPGPECHATRII